MATELLSRQMQAHARFGLDRHRHQTSSSGDEKAVSDTSDSGKVGGSKPKVKNAFSIDSILNARTTVNSMTEPDRSQSASESEHSVVLSDNANGHRNEARDIDDHQIRISSSPLRAEATRIDGTNGTATATSSMETPTSSGASPSRDQSTRKLSDSSPVQRSPAGRFSTTAHASTTMLPNPIIGQSAFGASSSNLGSLYSNQLLLAESLAIRQRFIQNHVLQRNFDAQLRLLNAYSHPLQPKLSD